MPADVATFANQDLVNIAKDLPLGARAIAPAEILRSLSSHDDSFKRSEPQASEAWMSPSMRANLLNITGRA